MRPRSVPYRALAIAAVGLLAACGDDPSPVKPSPLSLSPFAGIQVMGPDSIEPGQAVQFVANIRQADGTTKSATSMPNLRWRSSNNAMMSVSPSGVVIAGPSARGEAVITADITPQGTVRGTREVVVQPEGTYRIVGSVREADAPTIPIAGARVEVLDGSNFTFTDSTGQYRLYGVPPQSTMRITVAGYETLDEPLELTANITRDFGLKLDGPRGGPYALSVSAERVTAGSPLSVSWVAPLGRSPYDWISIYKPGSRNEAFEDIWWDYTKGATTGAFTIRAPSEPGLYEFRYFLDDGFEMVAKSSLIEVTTNAPASASQVGMSRR